MFAENIQRKWKRSGYLYREPKVQKTRLDKTFSLILKTTTVYQTITLYVKVFWFSHLISTYLTV